MWHKILRHLTRAFVSPEQLKPAREGYLSPQPASVLLGTENRQHLLSQLWDNTLLPYAHYERYFLTPLKHCVSLMQQLPATVGGHHAVPGGMVDYTLKTLVYAVRLSRGYMLPPGASAEEQSAQGAAWGAVVFYAALFHALSCLRHIEGELLNGEIWSPGITVPAQPYRFRFRPPTPDCTGDGLGTMLGMRLLPEEVIPWLSRTPAALDTLLAFIRGDFGHAGVICQIVEDAVQHAGGQWRGSCGAPSAPGADILPVAALSAADYGEPSGMITAAFPAPPLPPETGASALQSAGVLLSSELDESLALPVSEIPVARNDADTGDPAIVDVLSLMRLNSGDADELPCESGRELRVQSAVAHSPVLEEPPGSEGYGQQFISWLTEQITSGSMPVNGAESLIHITGGLVFLPAPHIFFSFMKHKSYPASLKNDVQRGFERLGLHYIRKGKGVFSCMKYDDENRKGRYEKNSGYLVRSKIIYGAHPVPDDSSFLFVSSNNSL
ncbi:hypothetical protein EJH27_02105 [Salmonella enterica subsp. enterica serovar Virchow]|nr:hypothetical protein [Salmonella enterica subsp. enterica serovar Virchow]